MDDPIYTFFSGNLAMVSKEEILKALENALRSADYWRQACLAGLSFTQTRSDGGVRTELNPHKAK